MGEFFCDCGAPLNENGECPYCDSPGLPFAINDPIWDRIYGNRLTPVAPDRAGAPGSDGDSDTRAAGEHDG